MPQEAAHVLVLEASVDDAALTVRALRLAGVILAVDVLSAHDEAQGRIRDDPRPALVVVADGRGVVLDGVVVAARALVPPSPVLHLRATEGHPAHPAASAALVKPMDYAEYLTAVGGAATRLLAA